MSVATKAFTKERSLCRKGAVDVVTVEIDKLDAARILQSEVKTIAGHKSVQIVEALADFSEIRQRPANGQVWVLF